MLEISSDKIFNAIKKLVVIANTHLPKDEYNKLYKLYHSETNNNSKKILTQILENAKLAYDESRPLCQDTGFVTVFLKLGQNVNITGDNLHNVINNAVEEAYKEFFYRKSIVNDPVFKRDNTKTNTPVLTHIELTSHDEIEIILSIKGGGCENISASRMLKPADRTTGIKDFVVQTIKEADSKPCPPIKVGIGIGSNFEGAAILSKKALLLNGINPNKDYQKLEKELLESINNLKIGAMGEGGLSTCFDVKIIDAPCHIASLPVCVSISCHSSRHAKVRISADGIRFDDEEYCFEKLQNENNEFINVNTSDVERIKSLNSGDFIKLSGKIFTARDAAHEKLEELIKHNKQLPFDINNAIIFYAGPCPKNEKEIIGPIGPTTSVRMDKYTKLFYGSGVLATIGKGQRSEFAINEIKKNNGKYFTATGGVASLLKRHVKKAEVIAFDDLGPEAVYELEVENLPLKVQI